MHVTDRFSVIAVVFNIAFIATVSAQMFDKRPTIYDHMKSGANTVKTNLIDTQLKWETTYLPEECTPIDEDNFFGDRAAEIILQKERLRLISVEEGDSVTMHYTVALDADGTVIATSRRPETDGDTYDDYDDADDDVTDNDFTFHYRPRRDDASEDEENKENEETDEGEKTEEGKEGEEGGHYGPLVTPLALFTVGYRMVIPGWDLAVRGMCVGEIRRIVVPPQLAYGAKGYKPLNIPGEATLEIETELVAVKKKNIVDHYMDFIYNLPVYAFFILGLSFLLSAYYKGQVANKRRLYREVMQRKEREEKED